MAKKNSEMKIPGQSWFLYVFTGVVLCVLWILVLAYPERSYNVFAVVFVIALAFMSLVQVYKAITKWTGPSWGWDIAFAIIYAILAIYLLVYPGITSQIFPFIIAFLTLFRGIDLLWVAGTMRSVSESTSWRWIGFAGIISLILSFVLMFNVAFVMPYVDVMLVIVFFAAGGGSIYAGMKLHDVYKKLKN